MCDVVGVSQGTQLVDVGGHQGAWWWLNGCSLVEAIWQGSSGVGVAILIGGGLVVRQGLVGGGGMALSRSMQMVGIGILSTWSAVCTGLSTTVGVVRWQG